MSNRIIKHSSRYKGPMGDSRSPAEIFAGIEARAQQAQECQATLIVTMDGIMENAKLITWESRLNLIRETVVDWLIENDPETAEKMKK